MFKFDKALRAEFKTNWLPLLTAFSCLLFGLSASAFSMPFLFPEVISAFGWSREEATLLASAKYVFASLGALVFGFIIHRVGEWFTLLFAMTLAGAAMLSWIWMDGLMLYYISGAMSGFAVGGGAVALKVLVARSFHSSQGTAYGVVLMGSALAGSLIPIVISFLISNFGWRYGYAAMSLTIWLIVVPLLVFGYFHTKKQRAATQASQAAQDTSSIAVPAINQEVVADRIIDFLRQKNFWMIAASIAISSVVDAGFQQHQVLILKDFSFSPTAVISIVTIMGFISVGARVLTGNILDSSSTKGLAGFYFLLAVACVTAPFLPIAVILVVFMLCRAFGHAVVLLDAAVITKHAFGNTSQLGLLFALMSVCTSLASAVGPWLMGRVFDATGSYNLAYAIFTGLSLVAVVLAFKIKPTYWLTLNPHVKGPA